MRKESSLDDYKHFLSGEPLDKHLFLDLGLGTMDILIGRVLLNLIGLDEILKFRERSKILRKGHGSKA